MPLCLVFVYCRIMVSPTLSSSRISVPNALSASRIIGVPFLFVLVELDDTGYFVLMYLLLAFTDWLDGYLARRWNQTTEFGSMLDSLGDIALYMSTVYFFIQLFPEYLSPNIPWLVLFAAFFVISVVVSKVRAGKIVFIHTHLSRFGAVFLVATFLSSFYLDTTLLITLVILNYTLAFAEVIVMFVKYGNVDPDTRSIFWLMKK
jgi:phosphatidylglycerophosphate synthase